MKNRTKLIVMIATLPLAACQTIDSGQGIGAAVGAITGGVVANQVAGENKALWTLAGAAAGAFVGSQIGRLIDDRDEAKVADATINAAESGEAQDWVSDETGASGTAHVTTADVGENCREIVQTVSLADGRSGEETVRACKRQDGAWEVVAA